MPDGFYDGGRDMEFEIDEKGQLNPISSKREIILLDQNQDPNLKFHKELAEKRLEGLKDPRERALALAGFVSNIMGGIQIGNQFSEFNLESECYQQIAAIKKHYGHNTIPIGYLNHGVCRHRGNLFKYLGDRLNIHSRLIRGNYAIFGHAWNVIEINGKYYLIDIMHNPHILTDETNDLNLIYHRINGKKEIVGGFGGKSIVR